MAETRTVLSPPLAYTPSVLKPVVSYEDKRKLALEKALKQGLLRDAAGPPETSSPYEPVREYGASYHPSSTDPQADAAAEAKR